MTAANRSLRESARQAMAWSAGVSLVRDVLQFGQMLILARLLDPSIYGAAAMTATLISFIGVPSFQHVIAHVLQVRGRDVNWYLHFTAGVAINGALFLVANLVAIALGFTAGYAKLQPLLHLASITFLLSVPSDMRIKMLERNHDWLRLRNLQLTAMAVSIASAIAMAVAGAGVYALIVPGLLATTVAVADLLVVTKWVPIWQWDRAGYRESLHFGLNRAASNTLNGGRALLQNTMITHQGQFFALGIFSRAEGLANMFCARVSQQATGALYPIVTRAEAQSDQFRRITGLAMRTVAWVVVPIACFLSLEATPLVATLYGHKWDAAAPLVPLAMGSGVAISIGATAYSFLLANNQSRLCLRADTVSFVLAAATMIALIPLGIRTYMIGAIFSNLVIAVMLLSLLIVTRGIQAKHLLSGFWPAVVAAGAATASVLAVESYLEHFAMWFQLVAAWVVFTGAYVLVLRVLFRPALTEILGYVPGGAVVGRVLKVAPP